MFFIVHMDMSEIKNYYYYFQLARGKTSLKFERTILKRSSDLEWCIDTYNCIVNRWYAMSGVQCMGARFVH